MSGHLNVNRFYLTTTHLSSPIIFQFSTYSLRSFNSIEYYDHYYDVIKFQLFHNFPSRKLHDFSHICNFFCSIYSWSHHPHHPVSVTCSSKFDAINRFKPKESFFIIFQTSCFFALYELFSSAHRVYRNKNNLQVLKAC